MTGKGDIPLKGMSSGVGIYKRGNTYVWRCLNNHSPSTFLLQSVYFIVKFLENLGHSVGYNLTVHG